MSRTRFLAGKPGISVLLAVFLGLALSACSSGVSQSKLDDANKQIADRERQQQQMQQQRTAAQNAISSANMLVGALTANSTTAQVQAAGDAVAAANTAIAAASSLSETERAGLTSQLNAVRANLASVTAMRDAAMERMTTQKTAAENALNAAQMAVDALNDGSTDAQVQAAAEALAAASAAITAATSLSDADKQALRNRLAMITTARDNRLGNRQMASQRMAANDALTAANTAVNGVNDDSSEADVQAADDAVAAASAAVDAATSLSAADRQGLADRLATIRRNLAGAKYRRQVAMENQEREERNTEMADQRTAAQNALNAARMAVNALMPTSSDEDAMAAAGLISAAETAVNAATSLAQSEQNGLRSQLANIEANLARTNTARNDLMTARTSTGTAATDAGTAATAAEGDATAAENAGMKLATLQTADLMKAPANYEASDSTSVNARFHTAQARDHAKMARKYAGMADDEKENADKAMTVAAAQAAQRAAETAKMKADEYRMKAMQEMDKAVAAAKMEVMAEGNNTYSVGGTTIVWNGEDGERVTSGGTETGRLQQNFFGGVTTKAAAVTGVAPNPATNTKYVQAVREGDPATIGMRYDAPNDMSRLSLVTQYLGARTVKVGVKIPTTNMGGDWRATVSSASRVGYPFGFLENTGPNRGALDGATVKTHLAEKGLYMITHQTVANGRLEATDIIGTQGPLNSLTMVYSYTETRGGIDRTYYVYRKETIFGTSGPARWTWEHVDIFADDDGDGSTANPTPEVEIEVPIAGRDCSGCVDTRMDYKHVNFGSWAELDKAGVADTSQAPKNLGLGFVQKTKDGTRTGSDMRNFGSATFNGHWVANVRAASTDGKGKIRQRNGQAQLVANFGSGAVTATLTHLAQLTGKITGDSFSGTTASSYGTGGSTHVGYLPAGKSYSGNLRGHFYGPRAEEAAGVFDFTSSSAKDGEFRGAFGVSEAAVEQAPFPLQN